MDLFIQGWDGVGTSLSNAGAAGKITHDILKGLFDFIGQFGTGLGEIMVWATTPIGQDSALKAQQDANFKSAIGGLAAANAYTRIVNGATNPKFASGGLVRATPGGIPATVGEGGSDEAIIPLDDARATARIAAALGGGGDTFNIYEVTDPTGTALAIQRRQKMRAA
jgi:hypothetical protein